MLGLSKSKTQIPSKFSFLRGSQLFKVCGCLGYTPVHFNKRLLWPHSSGKPQSGAVHMESTHNCTTHMSQCATLQNCILLCADYKV